MQYDLPDYYSANVAYQAGNFDEALNRFNEAIKKHPELLREDPLLKFKIGYALFRIGQWQKAVVMFRKSRGQLRILEDYLDYFRILSHLRLGDTLTVRSQVREFYQKYPQSTLIDLCDSLQARLYLAADSADSALKYFKRMLNSPKFEKTRLLLHVIRLEKELSDTSAFRKYGYRFLRSYPFHNQAETIYGELKKNYPDKIPETDLKRLFRYLFTTHRFLEAENLLSQQSKYSSSRRERDYFNWMAVEIAYREGEYQRVLNWCLTQRKHFKTPAILRKIDLHIARCYLKLGQVKKSIKAYLHFQKKYPDDSLSPEVLWKVAWLYEELKDISRANRIYHRLNRTYRHNKFYREAAFRIGLNYYRQGKMARARDAWQKALRRNRDRQQQARLRYWIGKSYEREGKYREQSRIYFELAQRPVDSFYNLKAFFLTSNGQTHHRKIKAIFWQIHHGEESYLGQYIPHFRRALLIKELLGPRWSDWELLALNPVLSNWTEVFALGELHERMGNYGRAYRKFRSIFNAHFSDSDLREMLPVFKKLYPFYYVDEIDSLARRFELPVPLIYSVIKKESAFEPRAISYANAYGLMQLIPTTASQIAPELGMQFITTDQLFVPRINLKMGSYYLRSLLRRYQGNLVMALAAYNAGPHRVDRWKKIYPVGDDDLFMENLAFEQTRVYVRTCLKYYWIYRQIINPGEIPPEILVYPIKLNEFF